MSGLLFSAAAVLFWLSWALMPGVGVTDPGQIFELVSSRRSLVAASVVLQLVSAAFYAPALVGLIARARLGRDTRAQVGSARSCWSVRWDSAADAVLHLLAYAMTGAGSRFRDARAGDGVHAGTRALAARADDPEFLPGRRGVSLALARLGVRPVERAAARGRRHHRRGRWGDRFVWHGAAASRRSCGTGCRQRCAGMGRSRVVAALVVPNHARAGPHAPPPPHLSSK